jgi:serine/threonine protein kinase
MIGRTIAHYRITAVIGSGGMGQVYRATDTRLNRDVALKVLPQEMASHPERLERFQREAKALASLDHPSIVTVHSVEESDGIHFLTMQLVEGQSLDTLIPSDGFASERIVEIASALADALSAAHQKGFVHRDLKPANIMLSESGRVKVLDFGLAKITTSAEPMPAGSDIATQMRTSEGVVMGTMPYMSPEQIEGREVDPRTDLFSLGVVLHQMATGRLPFQGPTAPALLSAILKDSAPDLKNIRPDLPEGLIQLIGRCLEKNRNRRIQSAKEIRDALESLRRKFDSANISQQSGGTSIPGFGGRPAIAVLPFDNLSRDPE